MVVLHALLAEPLDKCDFALPCTMKLRDRWPFLPFRFPLFVFCVTRHVLVHPVGPVVTLHW